MNIPSPLVFVVIPCLNMAHYFIPTLESVLQQDYPYIDSSLWMAAQPIARLRSCGSTASGSNGCLNRTRTILTLSIKGGG